MNPDIRKELIFAIIASVLVCIVSIFHRLMLNTMSGLIVLPVSALVWVIFFCSILTCFICLSKYSKCGRAAFLPFVPVLTAILIVKYFPATDFGSVNKRLADIEGIKSEFVQKRESFELLHTMIQEDTKVEVNEDSGVLSCFEVREDRIGDFSKHREIWSASADYERKLELESVLEHYDISKARYEEYLFLFSETNSERVSYCVDKPGRTSILVHRHGFVFGGCSTTIEINGNKAVPEPMERSNFSIEIHPLGGGWYLEHFCN